MRAELRPSFWLVIGLCCVVTVASAQAQTASPSAKGPAASPPSSTADESRSEDDQHGSITVPSDDTMMRNAAARTRMNECGHQWSAKKKAGTAVGTWKDFFKTCLIHQ